MRTLDDKQVLQQCMTTLRELFKEQVREALLKEGPAFPSGRDPALSMAGDEGSPGRGPTLPPCPTHTPGWPCQGWPNGIPQDPWLRQQKVILKFWRLEIQDQGGSRLGLFSCLSLWLPDGHSLLWVLLCSPLSSSPLFARTYTSYTGLGPRYQPHFNLTTHQRPNFQIESHCDLLGDLLWLGHQHRNGRDTVQARTVPHTSLPTVTFLFTPHVTQTPFLS